MVLAIFHHFTEYTDFYTFVCFPHQKLLKQKAFIILDSYFYSLSFLLLSFFRGSRLPPLLAKILFLHWWGYRDGIIDFLFSPVIRN